jgi:signal transduction histidine kinase
MRERVRELGGSFALESASPGTIITVTIPLLQNAELSRDPEEEDSDSIQGASAA